MGTVSGSQVVLREFQGIREQFVGDPKVHLCNGYFEVCYFLIEGTLFCLNDGGTSLSGDVFVSYVGPYSI